MGKLTNNQYNTKTYRFDRDGTYKFILPDFYKQIGKGKKTMPEQALSFECVQEGFSSTVSVWLNDIKNALPFNQPQLIIDELHKTLKKDEGLIEVNNGTTADGRKFIYFINKYKMKTGTPGTGYHMCMHIDCGKKALLIQSYFNEKGITGSRESLVFSFLQNQGEVDIGPEDNSIGWSADPYDPNFKKGFLMNQSEQEIFDEYFPSHPLTKCREMRDFFISTSMDETRKTVAPKVGQFAKKAQEQSKILAVNISQAGKAGKEKIQETLRKKSSDDLGENEDLKHNELDDKLMAAVDDYNDVYTIMNARGSALLIQRERSIDILRNVENLINSIANHPKEFDSDISEIIICRQEFKQVCDYAKQELEVSKKSAMSAGAGLAGGAAVVSLGSNVAMWVATTFGTASTGTAISALSGAAAESAALAWLGGGTIAAGGGGMAAGNALLALAGPVGWSIAGATILTTVVIFANKRMKLDKEKKEEIEKVLVNTEKIREADVKIKDILDKTVQLREGLSEQYNNCLTWYEKDYLSVPDSGQYQLGSLVNQAKSLAMMLGKGV